MAAPHGGCNTRSVVRIVVLYTRYQCSLEFEHVPASALPQSTASDEWYPWRSRAVSQRHIFLLNPLSRSVQAVTLDLVMNLPRSTFSIRQIDVMRWLLKANGASHVPSSKTIRAHNNALHNMCGVRTLQYTGAFGNTFFVNSLADLIAQVMWVHSLAVRYMCYITRHRKWPTHVFGRTFASIRKTPGD
jgi:hypothetical protein